eukprot:3912029-Rhodomonas_salina.1
MFLRRSALRHARDNGCGGVSALHQHLPSLEKLPEHPEYYTVCCSGLGNVLAATGCPVLSRANDAVQRQCSTELAHAAISSTSYTPGTPLA